MIRVNVMVRSGSMLINSEFFRLHCEMGRKEQQMSTHGWEIHRPISSASLPDDPSMNNGNRKKKKNSKKKKRSEDDDDDVDK